MYVITVNSVFQNKVDTYSNELVTQCIFVKSTHHFSHIYTVIYTVYNWKYSSRMYDN